MLTGFDVALGTHIGVVYMRGGDDITRRGSLCQFVGAIGVVIEVYIVVCRSFRSTCTREKGV
jgi:hypothetical protein